MACKKDHHDVLATLRDLPESQKNAFRHVCAACAYEEGLLHGERQAAAYYRKKLRKLLAYVRDLLEE